MQDASFSRFGMQISGFQRLFNQPKRHGVNRPRAEPTFDSLFEEQGVLAVVKPNRL